MDGYFHLGTYARACTTESVEAQTWFDRGLMWTYGFHHEEAVVCFEKAAQADPGFAMAHWGMAYALGPNYNKPWEFFDDTELPDTLARTHEAVERAGALAGGASEVEQALIAALRSRYPATVPAAYWAVWNSEYAEAMGEVHARFPDDVDVATLYADALMNLTPWGLWDLATGEPAAGSRTVEARAVLERTLTREEGRMHPGALHLYIHLMEMSPTPEVALTAADRLRGLVPDAGHLHHMPTHLDLLCGDYRRAIASNLEAVEADERYVARAGAMNFYTLYRAHDYHFLIYAAMFAGQSRVALEAVTALERAIPEDLLRVESPPMADWLEGFLAMRVHALIRFGRWDDVLALPLPDDPELFCTATAMTHYARGVSLAALGRVPEAEEEQRLFTAAVGRVPESRTLFNNTCQDILAIADEMLAGELCYRRGEFDAAFAHLQRSIALDDALPYDEPWGWMQPTRHAYGALLLEQGRVEEAAAVYAADLGIDGSLPRAQQHPNNVWALHGYHECLTRLGREAEARIIARQLSLATAVADVPVQASCFCRISAITVGVDIADDAANVDATDATGSSDSCCHAG